MRRMPRSLGQAKRTKTNGRGKKGDKADAAPSPALTAPIISEVLDDNATATRKKVWLDDVLCAITNVLDAVGKHKSAEGDWRAIPASLKSFQRSVRVALMFCFEESVTINGKALKNWSQVRKEIKSDLVKTHKN